MIVLNTAPKSFQLRWNSINDKLTAGYLQRPANGDWQMESDLLADALADLEDERRELLALGQEKGWFFS